MGRKASTKSTSEKEANDLAKAIFIAALAEAMTITIAAEVAGIDRKTAYNWREKDEEFAQAWDAALEAGTDRLEQEAIRRASHGLEEPVVYQGQLTPIWERDEHGEVKLFAHDTGAKDPNGNAVIEHRPRQLVINGQPQWLTLRKPSDTLMIFLLKARRPEQYRERFQTEHTGPNGQPLPPAQVAPVFNVTLATKE